jgi:hypothetical protein
MKKEIALGIIALLIGIVLTSGCTSITTDQAKFVGSWKATNGTGLLFDMMKGQTMTFFSDGTYSAGSLGGNTYQIKDGKLLLNDIIYSYQFSNGDKTVTITQDVNSPMTNSLVLMKQ